MVLAKSHLQPFDQLVIVFAVGQWSGLYIAQAVAQQDKLCMDALVILVY